MTRKASPPCSPVASTRGTRTAPHSASALRPSASALNMSNASSAVFTNQMISSHATRQVQPPTPRPNDCQRHSAPAPASWISNSTSARLALMDVVNRKQAQKCKRLLVGGEGGCYEFEQNGCAQSPRTCMRRGLYSGKQLRDTFVQRAGAREMRQQEFHLVRQDAAAL